MAAPRARPDAHCARASVADTGEHSGGVDGPGAWVWPSAGPLIYPFGYDRRVNTATTLRRARSEARLSQTELAARIGTSQATISAYECGRKIPSVETLSRLLAATGHTLAVEPAPRTAGEPSRRRHLRNARALLDVIALAEALPSRHDPRLRYPRLPVASP